MEIDVDKLREKIKLLQEVEKLVSNPEARAILEGFVVNGNGTSNGTSTAATVSPRKPAEPEVRRYAPKKGTKKGAILTAVRETALRQNGPFDGYHVTKVMLANGYAFASKTPAYTVLDAIRIMVKKGELRVYSPGKAGRPTIFVKNE